MVCPVFRQSARKDVNIMPVCRQPGRLFIKDSLCAADDVLNGDIGYKKKSQDLFPPLPFWAITSREGPQIQFPRETFSRNFKTFHAELIINIFAGSPCLKPVDELLFPVGGAL